MMRIGPLLLALFLVPSPGRPGEPARPTLVARPDAFQTLVNPACSHCRDEAKRRAQELKPGDRVLCWTRGYSDGGAIPFRFFLAPYRVISDSYGVFVYDPEAGYARGFAPSYAFRFHGWRNGVLVMKHKDGTLYSCLTGLAFEGPRKGSRLTPIPAVVSDWGFWLEHYPGAVAYHMFDKYRPVDLPTADNPDSVRSRGKADPRLGAREEVLGVWTGAAARAYPLADLARGGLLREEVGGGPVVVLWEPRTRTASAYRPVASQPRKFKGPQPNEEGISPPDAGETVPPGTPVVPPRKVTLALAPEGAAGRFQDGETHSFWDVAGRCIAGELKGWTLEWVDSVQVKWFAWAAEHPETSIYKAAKAAAAKHPKKMVEVAGKAEFLRLLPKPFALLKAVDPQARTVTLLADGEATAKMWAVEPDAELKVGGWWGRLEQFHPGDRVWAWLKLDRQRKPVTVAMLADALSEFDLHGSLGPKAGSPPAFTPEQVDQRRAEQKAWLRARWVREGLPGTLTFNHIFSGELEVMLDHEGMRWGRSLARGDAVQLTADPPIQGMVKAVCPWRERTLVRLVVGELQAADLRLGQRLGLKMAPPKGDVLEGPYPPDLDRPRSKAERVEWFLASVYCPCGVGNNTCTGDFYTLASCNPNGCGMPNYMRQEVGRLLDKGLTDRQVFDELRKTHGPLLLRPHLRP
jgi:hypothetical protein